MKCLPACLSGMEEEGRASFFLSPFSFFGGENLELIDKIGLLHRRETESLQVGPSVAPPTLFDRFPEEIAPFASITENEGKE